MDCKNYIVSGQNKTSAQEITEFIKNRHPHLAVVFEPDEIYNEQTYNKIIDLAFSGVVDEDLLDQNNN
jgi:hypothetical protein